MFDIEFWEDKKGYSDVADYIENLSKKSDKNSRVILRKIVAYIDIFSEKGVQFAILLQDILMMIYGNCDRLIIDLCMHILLETKLLFFLIL